MGDAAGWLHGHADAGLLRTLSTLSVTGTTVDPTPSATRNRTVRGPVPPSGVGRPSERDAPP